MEQPAPDVRDGRGKAKSLADERVEEGECREEEGEAEGC